MHRKLSWLSILAVFLVASSGLAETTNSSSVSLPNIDREFRGVWVASVANIDWPSAPGLPVEKQKEELQHILNRAKHMNLNAVILQVRPACDALYHSKLEPWSEYITGKMGQAPEPSYDPLKFAIKEAHERGLELHAWINPYRAKHSSSKSEISPDHVSKKHPELVLTYGKHLWLDPGKKEVQEYSLKVMMDIVNRYDIDGLHMDDYFYPYKEKNEAGEIIEFPDDESFMQYVADGGLLSRDDWRRENVNEFIEKCYKAVKSSKPLVKFGISPFGIWQPGFPEQITGFNAFNEIYCDSRKWLTNGWCDYISPQLYWKIEATNQSYPVLLKWWTEQNDKGRHIWPGNFTSRVPDQWNADEIVNQVKVTREETGASGNIHFSMKPLLSNKGDITDRLSKVYERPALVPASPWLDENVPAKPSLSVKRDKGGVRIDWQTANPKEVWQWVIQKRVGGKWYMESYPAERKARLIKDEEGNPPEVIAVLAVNRAGVAGIPAIYEKQPK